MSGGGVKILGLVTGLKDGDGWRSFIPSPCSLLGAALDIASPTFLGFITTSGLVPELLDDTSLTGTTLFAGGALVGVAGSSVKAVGAADQMGLLGGVGDGFGLDLCFCSILRELETLLNSEDFVATEGFGRAELERIASLFGASLSSFNVLTICVPSADSASCGAGPEELNDALSNPLFSMLGNFLDGGLLMFGPWLRSTLVDRGTGTEDVFVTCTAGVLLSGVSVLGALRFGPLARPFVMCVRDSESTSFGGADDML